MRVLFETPPAPVTLNYRESGQLHHGFGHLQVLVFEPDEEPPVVPGTNQPYHVPTSLAKLRRPDGKIVATPTKSFVGQLAPVEIPDSLLAPLPPNAKLFFAWLFSPGVV